MFTHSFNQLINEWINQSIVLFLSRGLKLTHQRVLASHKASVSSQVLIKSLSYQDQCVFSSCIVWTQTRNSTIKRFVFHRHCKHSIKFSNQRSMHAPLQRTLSFYCGLFTDPLFSRQVLVIINENRGGLLTAKYKKRPTSPTEFHESYFKT